MTSAYRDRRRRASDPDRRPSQGGHRPRRLLPGTGQFKLNGRTLEEYFPNKVHQQLIREPFVTLEKAEQYDVVGLLKGGGVTGQAGALRLGIARALIEIEIEDRPALKKAGFLTRDPRVKERKKYGLKKARRPSVLQALTSAFRWVASSGPTASGVGPTPTSRRSWPSRWRVPLPGACRPRRDLTSRRGRRP